MEKVEVDKLAQQPQLRPKPSEGKGGKRFDAGPQR